VIDHTDQQILKERLRVENRRLHNEYKNKYSKTFKLMDILFVSFIMLNMGALMLTNMLVLKTEPNMTFQEANPAASEIHDFEPHPQAASLFSGFIFQMLMYGILFLSYFSNRNNIRSHTGLILNFTLIFFMFFICFTDFTNNLGYYIGRLLWGV